MIPQKTYNIISGYRSNPTPTHHNDISWTDESQNEVYQFSRKLLDEKQLNTVIDLGCGSGFKLIKYFDDKETIGIETEPCLSFLKTKYANKKWIHSGEPEKSFSNYRESCDIIICADVIEHILDPDDLLHHIKQYNFKYLIISTPDRSVLKTMKEYGDKAWFGPPVNKSHVREWTYDELHLYIKTHFKTVNGFHCEKQKECMFFVCEI